jgi:hypothetical protein
MLCFFWFVTYYSGTADPLTLWIDELTGKMDVSSVTDKAENAIPLTY